VITARALPQGAGISTQETAMTLEHLRALAKEAGHHVGSEVHKFLDWIEGKDPTPVLTVGELQAQEAAARATEAQDQPEQPQA
jgi:hypothetical protein